MIERQLHAKYARAQKYHIRNNLLQKIFVYLIFVGGVTHENFLTTKISCFTVYNIYGTWGAGGRVGGGEREQTFYFIGLTAEFFII